MVAPVLVHDPLQDRNGPSQFRRDGREARLRTLNSTLLIAASSNQCPDDVVLLVFTFSLQLPPEHLPVDPYVRSVPLMCSPPRAKAIENELEIAKATKRTVAANTVKSAFIVHPLYKYRTKTKTRR
jgi:hypothetical protein